MTHDPTPTPSAADIESAQDVYVAWARASHSKDPLVLIPLIAAAIAQGRRAGAEEMLDRWRSD